MTKTDALIVIVNEYNSSIIRTQWIRFSDLYWVESIIIWNKQGIVKAILLGECEGYSINDPIEKDLFEKSELSIKTIILFISEKR